MKLSEYTGEQVFLKELYECDDNNHLPAGGIYMTKAEAIEYIAFRKCVNMAFPNVYTNDTLTEQLGLSDIGALINPLDRIRIREPGTVIIAGHGCGMEAARLLKGLLESHQIDVGIEAPTLKDLKDPVAIVVEDIDTELFPLRTLDPMSDSRLEKLAKSIIDINNREYRRENNRPKEPWKKDYSDIRRRRR